MVPTVNNVKTHRSQTARNPLDAWSQCLRRVSAGWGALPRLQEQALAALTAHARDSCRARNRGCWMTLSAFQRGAVFLARPYVALSRLPLPADVNAVA